MATKIIVADRKVLDGEDVAGKCERGKCEGRKYRKAGSEFQVLTKLNRALTKCIHIQFRSVAMVTVIGTALAASLGVSAGDVMAPTRSPGSSKIKIEAGQSAEESRKVRRAHRHLRDGVGSYTHDDSIGASNTGSKGNPEVGPYAGPNLGPNVGQVGSASGGSKVASTLNPLDSK